MVVIGFISRVRVRFWPTSLLVMSSLTEMDNTLGVSRPSPLINSTRIILPRRSFFTLTKPFGRLLFVTVTSLNGHLLGLWPTIKARSVTSENLTFSTKLTIPRMQVAFEDLFKDLILIAITAIEDPLRD